MKKNKPDIKSLLEIMSTYETKEKAYYQRVDMNTIRLNMFIKYLKPYLEDINNECKNYVGYPGFITCKELFHNRKERVCLITGYPTIVIYSFDTTHLFNNVIKFHKDFEIIKQEAIEKAKIISAADKRNNEVVQELTEAFKKEEYVGCPKQVNVSYARDYGTSYKKQVHLRYKSFYLGKIELPLLEQISDEKKDRLIKLALYKFRKAFYAEMGYKLLSMNNINLVNKTEMFYVAKHAIKIRDLNLAKKLYKYKHYSDETKQKLEGMAVAGRLIK